MFACKREVEVKVKVKLYCKKVLRWSREDPISTTRRDPLYRPLPAITLTLVTHTYESHDLDSQRVITEIHQMTHISHCATYRKSIIKHKTYQVRKARHQRGTRDS